MASITVKFGEQTTGTHTLAHVPFVVGRDEGCDLRIDNLGVSGKHCRFVWSEGKLKVEDMGSTNGTKVNGERVESAEVKDGDEVELGKFSLVLQRAEDEERPPTREDAGAFAKELEQAVTGKESEKRSLSDKTFSMNAADIRAAVKMAGPSQETQRAGSVAEPAGLRESEKAPSGGISRTALFAILGVMAVAIIGLAALIAVLVMGK